jgi:hypothetical protein
MSDPNAYTFDPGFQIAERGDDSEATFNVNLRGRKLVVTVASERRPLDELLREFVEIFESQIASLQ